MLPWSLHRDTRPDEVYNLGAQSHVQVSFQLPQYTGEASGMVRPFPSPDTCCHALPVTLLLLGRMGHNPAHRPAREAAPGPG